MSNGRVRPASPLSAGLCLIAVGFLGCAVVWPNVVFAQTGAEDAPIGRPSPDDESDQDLASLMGEFLAPGEILGDLHRLVSLETPGSFLILGVGAALTGIAADDPDEAAFEILGPESLGEVTHGMSALGSRTFLYPALATAFFTTKAIGDQGAATTVAQMTQALLVTDLTLTPIKFAVGRVRPDGGQLSFPSGHTAGMFAVATVLNRRYGNKVGIPAYMAATLMGAARIDERRHYLSDVIAGAAIGIAAARVVSDRFEGRSLRVHPVVAPGGGRGLGLTLEF